MYYVQNYFLLLSYLSPRNIKTTKEIVLEISVQKSIYRTQDEHNET